MCDQSDIIEEETLVEKKYVEWKIQDFLKPIKCYADTLSSSPFSFIERMWYLQISTRHYRHTLISLHLFSKSADASQSVTYTLGIKYLEREINRITGKQIFNVASTGWGRQNFYSIENFLKLCEKASEIPLTVFCYLEYHSSNQFVVDAESQTLLYSTASLSSDFENLLASGRQSDVTIQVRDREFKAHKSILVARSPVFAAMFGHDMSEKNNGFVRIDDFDPDTFHIFLQCMYNGNLKHVSADNLISLYTAADKYSVTDLKEICVQFMEEELSTDYACGFLVLADTYNETYLKNCVEKFLIKNMKEVLPTSNWKSFMSEHTSMAQEILIKSFAESS